jgi:penicillin amidase
MSGRDWLRRLGAGESIEAICRAAGWSRGEFDAWWQRESASRASRCDGQLKCGVRGKVTIQRDNFGIPHISADSHDDLWFGFGLAMAQDRLFQLDYLRRKGLGRLAEVLGAEGLPSDLIARTVGLNRIARDELTRLPQETLTLLEAFSAGVNAWISECGERLPIEFDLLDYRPELWSPLDCLAIENEFRWYLTGRFHVIVMPELAKRLLGEGALYRDLLLGEADDEAIISTEAYADRRREIGDRPLDEVGQTTGHAEQTGSNNWVVAGQHTLSGKPLVASDPHIAIEAVSCWYQAHLHGGDFNVAGMAYVGMPAILCGRTERVAWGITNNICSQRDLYQEKTDGAHPGCFLFDGKWESQRQVVEVIQVKGSEPVTRTIRYSRNGPIVDEILPPPGDKTGPVSLKWLGTTHGGWLTSLLAMNRAGNVAEFHEALRPWHVPTFNVVAGDTAGHIFVQCTGRIPIRTTAERCYRPGWDPQQQWQGLLPFESTPGWIDPPRGWLATANNRLVGHDYPHALYGGWVSGYRAQRIRQMIEATLKENTGKKFGVGEFRDMHQDSVSLRAVACLEPVTAELSDVGDPLVQEAVEHLRKWDGRIEPDLVAPMLFNVFFTFWTKTVALARFDAITAELMVKQAEALANRLIAADPHGWFAPGQRSQAIRRTFGETLQYLSQRLGPKLADWKWERLHRLDLKHVLSTRGDLGKLLDHGGISVRGDTNTVCNTGTGADWQVISGAGYRQIADLSETVLRAIDAPSQSGQPGTTHYSDQLDRWQKGEYLQIPLDRAEVEKIAVHRLECIHS